MAVAVRPAKIAHNFLLFFAQKVLTKTNEATIMKMQGRINTT